MIAARSTRHPKLRLLFSAGARVSGGQRVEAAAREAELVGGFGGRQGVLPESFEHLPDERGRVTMEQLLVFFKGGEDSRNKAPPQPVFSSAIATLGLLKDWLRG